MSGYWTGVLVILAINVIVAYAAFLPLAAGQLNLGVAGFMAIGAYASAFVSNELAVPVVGAIFAGGAVAGLIGIVVGVPVLRTRGIYLALATFALGEVVKGVLVNWETLGGAAGYPVLEFVGLPTIAVFALGVFLLVLFLFNTRFGLCLTAVEDDERVADLFGINVQWTQVAAFAIGAFVAGVGGALYGHHYSFIEAQRFNILLSIYIVLYVLLGGTQTILGPLLGAAFFTLLPEALRDSAEWRYAIFAAAIILMMVWRPQGIVTRRAVERLFAGRGPRERVP